MIVLVASRYVINYRYSRGRSRHTEKISKPLDGKKSIQLKFCQMLKKGRVWFFGYSSMVSWKGIVRQGIHPSVLG